MACEGCNLKTCVVCKPECLPTDEDRKIALKCPSFCERLKKLSIDKPRPANRRIPEHLARLLLQYRPEHRQYTSLIQLLADDRTNVIRTSGHF